MAINCSEPRNDLTLGRGKDKEVVAVRRGGGEITGVGCNKELSVWVLRSAGEVDDEELLV